MNDPKRQEIKERIAASQARNEARDGSVMDRVGEGAVEAKDEFTSFVREHPLVTVAGGVALGILVAGMFPSARNAARRGGARAAGIATLGSEMALAYLHDAMDAASDAGRAGADRLEDIGDSLGDTARGLRREAAYRASRSGDGARIASRETGKSLRRSFRRFTD